jgi:hypothetical protein
MSVVAIQHSITATTDSSTTAYITRLPSTETDQMPTQHGNPLSDTLEGFIRVDVTMPGVIRLPVCGPEHALQNWDKSDKTTEHYPCNKS